MKEPKRYRCIQNPNHEEFVAIDDGVPQHCPQCGYAADPVKGRYVWRPAKNILLTLTICFVLTLTVNAQDVCPSGMVCVPQETANKLFNTVEQLIEAKNVIEKMLKERGASDAALASAMQVIEGWKNLDAINNTIIAKQKDVIALYERTIQLYAGLVETLEKRLAKPRSAWSKFLDGLKTVLTLAAGVALGRGL